MNVRDPGLQAERTQLAWVRTGAVMVVDTALLLRIAFASNSVPLGVCASLLGAAAIVVIALGIRRGRLLASVRPSSPDQGLMAALSTVGVLAAGCALWALSA